MQGDAEEDRSETNDELPPTSIEKPGKDYIGTLDRAGRFIKVSGETPEVIDLDKKTIRLIVHELPLYIYILNTDDSVWPTWPGSYRAKVWLSEHDCFECEASVCIVNPHDKKFKKAQVTVRLVDVDLKDKVARYLSSTKRKASLGFFSVTDQPAVTDLDGTLSPRSDLKPFKLARLGK